MAVPKTLPYTDDPEANELLAQDPLALLIGLILYQQVPMEKAFMGPMELKRRLGGRLDAELLADMDPEELETIFAQRPALHRFPAAMAKRVQAVARELVERYDGDVTRLWRDVESADELAKRVKQLPGFGDYKARIYLGLLAERFGVKPKGWEKYRPDWPTVVDVSKPEDRAELKARKKAWKESQKK